MLVALLLCLSDSAVLLPFLNTTLSTAFPDCHQGLCSGGYLSYSELVVVMQWNSCALSSACFSRQFLPITACPLFFSALLPHVLPLEKEVLPHVCQLCLAVIHLCGFSERVQPPLSSIFSFLLAVPEDCKQVNISLPSQNSLLNPYLNL